MPVLQLQKIEFALTTQTTKQFSLSLLPLQTNKMLAIQAKTTHTIHKYMYMVEAIWCIILTVILKWYTMGMHVTGT